MDFRLLGPLEVVDRESPLPIAAGKQRALLAILLLSANTIVGRDRIIDDLWGDEAPDSAQKMVQIYVSRLRKALPDPRLHTRPPGYELEVREGELDLERFEHLVGDARSALSSASAADAADLLRSALALWRGRALSEFSEPFAQHEGARLEELRVAALELRIAADLELGLHRDLVGELETLIARHPLRERLREQHVLALYRSGRQAEALASYQAFRRTLDDELGIEPSWRLKELERQMLRQDPALDASAERERAPVSPPVPISGHQTTEGLSDIAYARSGDVRIAYQVVGDGPLDLVLVHGWVCTFQPAWENPRMASFYRRLAAMGRLILFDKRGTGLSDRVSPERLPDLETRMDDLRAVMEAVGSERAVLLGVSEGGPMSVLFAATYPERTVALVLMGTFARMMRAPDYPIGLAEDDHRRRMAALEEDDWARASTLEWLGRVTPNLVLDEAAVRWYTSYVMRGASPGASRAIRDMNAQIDIRGILGSITVPTLVLYRAREYFKERTRYLGERIPGARVVELQGDEHLPWEGDQSALLSEIERFLAGVHEEVTPDRVLATLLFTDIVGSTAKAAEIGDREWHELLARHNRLVRGQLARFRGREADTAGDGVFAVFDGPARAVRCATSIVRAVRALGLEIRAGVHTGEIQTSDGEFRGLAVHIAARIMAAAQPGEVLVSSTVKDIVVGSGIAFEGRGERMLKGVPEPWRVYAAVVQ